MTPDPVLNIIESSLPGLTKSEARIARYILNNETQIGLETGASLAAATNVSEITVSRFLQKLGFRGIRELKQRLKSTPLDYPIESTERFMRLLSGHENSMIEGEARAIRKLSRQVARKEWQDMADCISQCDRVFLTGFQTVRGMAQDFACRLNLLRDSVQFVSVTEGGLAEWTSPSSSGQSLRSVFVLVDIMPYAREAEKCCELALKRGFDVVVFTDEFNNWAYNHTELVFHAETKTGPFLESTASLNSLLNFATHAVAERKPQQSRTRVDNWLAQAKELDLF